MAVDRLLVQGREIEHRASEGSAHEVQMESFSKRVEKIFEETFIGFAEPGSETSEAKWQIRRISFDSNGNLSQRFAQGDVEFDNVWDDYASLSYL